MGRGGCLGHPAHLPQTCVHLYLTQMTKWSHGGGGFGTSKFCLKHKMTDVAMTRRNFAQSARSRREPVGHVMWNCTTCKRRHILLSQSLPSISTSRRTAIVMELCTLRGLLGLSDPRNQNSTCFADVSDGRQFYFHSGRCIQALTRALEKTKSIECLCCGFFLHDWLAF